jgi:hypothetical protein
MSRSLSSWSCALGACAIAGWPLGAKAQMQSNPVVVVSPISPPLGAERRGSPNRILLGAGIATFVIGYGASASVPIDSDHKGDKNLYAPMVGPWMNLANRGCVGPTTPTASGPLELTSRQHCGTSSIEGAALVAGGILQGLGAIAVMSSFFVQDAPRRVFEAPAMPRFAIIPMLSANSLGAIARGRF